VEATLFTGWIYDHLLSGGAVVKVAHPAMLQAIAVGKKKNDRVDARKIADLLRCDYFPECHMAPREIRDRRRVLRYRNLLVRQAVQMKNKVSGLPRDRDDTIQPRVTRLPHLAHAPPRQWVQGSRRPKSLTDRKRNLCQTSLS
jgi:hypothetical protein